MFVYLVTTTDGYEARITTAGDPTDHPAFYGRILSVTTVGPAGLRVVSDPSDKV